ncbi:hypothetical protein FS837_011342 [Tulasnella sp. UAMH 9824]|nr:hypothetical protein FS837_011342 [Tulasnella sp. UAMH 9824]
MGGICSKADTHSGGHQVLGSGTDHEMRTRNSERPAPQTIGAAPGSRMPVTSQKMTTQQQQQRTATASSHQRSPSAGSIPKSAIPVPTRTTSPPINQRAPAPPAQVSKKDLPKKSRGKGAPTPSPEERRLAAAAAAEERVKAQQSRGIVTSNPNAGKLSAKLQDEKTARPMIPSTRDEPELRWD